MRFTSTWDIKWELLGHKISQEILKWDYLFKNPIINIHNLTLIKYIFREEIFKKLVI